ncbi:hypothetical protein GTY87_15040 [Streptomyces sp. SID7813]|uniref:Uncharacterized protein n=1 Tax=Streptomyces coelicolor (strain ATCC BAA-471 / A3(2) / M145) TaxID=100226 RepID=Q9L1T8_STRCO|nr:hypothetical protein [Streptomyces sp. SID7813]QFI43047.1 hypothetical protein FQ762_15155 [Streptomyces coelicolor A3(2)]CAB72203.1 hypothetical protein SCE59.16c [Streptomyces coelicolor A3(2)]
MDRTRARAVMRGAGRARYGRTASPGPRADRQPAPPTTPRRVPADRPSADRPPTGEAPVTPGGRWPVGWGVPWGAVACGAPGRVGGRVSSGPRFREATGVLGARCSVLGARCSVLGGRWSVLGARCSVPGGRSGGVCRGAPWRPGRRAVSVVACRRACGSGRLRVSSVLGARCSVLGARCSVLGARCPVPGGR